ncbi:LPS export ABC transporter permease LptF [soil metagenome]
MVFEKALRRELLAAASGVFVALLAILISTTLVRVFGQAAAGKVGIDAIALLIGLSVVNSMPIMLVLTVFVSVLLVVSRLYRDSEMVVWFASGVSLNAFIRPIMVFAVPGSMIVLLFSMVVSPWANQQRADLKTAFEQRDDVARVSPGQFIESTRADRVFFVENLDASNGLVDNVFAVLAGEQGREAIVVADAGHVVNQPSGERYVVLENGHRYEGVPGSAGYSVMDFDTYSIRLESHEVDLGPQGADAHFMDAQQLVDDATPRARGELLWRLGLGVLPVVLSLLAIPLAFLNPRAGRSLNLIFAILLFVVYHSLLNLMQSRVASGRLDFGVGWWPLHAAFLLLAIALLQRQSAARSNRWSLSRWWRDRRNKAAA